MFASGESRLLGARPMNEQRLEHLLAEVHCHFVSGDA
jgi:hypothetical protein